MEIIIKKGVKIGNQYFLYDDLAEKMADDSIYKLLWPYFAVKLDENIEYIKLGNNREICEGYFDQIDEIAYYAIKRDGVVLHDYDEKIVDVKFGSNDIYAVATIDEKEKNLIGDSKYNHKYFKVIKDGKVFFDIDNRITDVKFGKNNIVLTKKGNKDGKYFEIVDENGNLIKREYDVKEIYVNKETDEIIHVSKNNSITIGQQEIGNSNYIITRVKFNSTGDLAITKKNPLNYHKYSFLVKKDGTINKFGKKVMAIKFGENGELALLRYNSSKKRSLYTIMKENEVLYDESYNITHVEFGPNNKLGLKDENDNLRVLFNGKEVINANAGYTDIIFSNNHIALQDSQNHWSILNSSKNITFEDLPKAYALIIGEKTFWYDNIDEIKEKTTNIRNFFPRNNTSVFQSTTITIDDSATINEYGFTKKK